MKFHLLSPKLCHTVQFLPRGESQLILINLSLRQGSFKAAFHNSAAFGSFQFLVLSVLI